DGLSSSSSETCWISVMSWMFISSPGWSARAVPDETRRSRAAREDLVQVTGPSSYRGYNLAVNGRTRAARLPKESAQLVQRGLAARGIAGRGGAAPAVPVPVVDAAEAIGRRRLPDAPEGGVAAALLVEVDGAGGAFVPGAGAGAVDGAVAELGEDDGAAGEKALELDAHVAPAAREVVDGGGGAGLDEREVGAQADDVDEIVDGHVAVVIPVARVHERAVEDAAERGDGGGPGGVVGGAVERGELAADGEDGDVLAGGEAAERDEALAVAAPPGGAIARGERAAPLVGRARGGEAHDGEERDGEAGGAGVADGGDDGRRCRRKARVVDDHGGGGIGLVPRDDELDVVGA